MSKIDLVFNRTNASTLLGILPHQVKKVEVWSNCVYVYGNKISKFVSKKKFLQQFVDTRKEKAKSLVVQKISPSEFIVFNPENGHKYWVELLGKKIECGCEDYRNQIMVFGKAACKHIYCTIFSLGFTSLKEYENSVN